MKEECEIVQDLLFCYHDGIASNGSKRLVENHLRTCDECRQVLEDMEKDEKRQDYQEEIDYLGKINKKMKRKTIITIISLMILVVFILGNLYILFSFYQEGYYITIILKDEISSEQLEDIKQLLVAKCGEDKINYSSKEQALNEVKEKFKDKKELIDTYSDDNPFKATLTVKTKEREKKEVLQLLENLDGIRNISTSTIENPYLWFISNILKNV